MATATATPDAPSAEPCDADAAGSETACVVVIFKSGKELCLCRHHLHQHESALDAAGVVELS